MSGRRLYRFFSPGNVWEGRKRTERLGPVDSSLSFSAKRSS